MMTNIIDKPAPALPEPQPELGPAMRALHLRWQKAVTALFLTKGNRSAALRAAGYKAKGNGLHVLASRIFADARVRAAVREVALQTIETSEPELLATTLDIMRDTATRPADRLAAARMVWDRANPVMTKHKVEIEHHLSSNELDVQHYRAQQKNRRPARGIPYPLRSQRPSPGASNDLGRGGKAEADEPALGSGLIYQTPESLIVEDVDPLSWPTHWFGAGGWTTASTTRLLPRSQPDMDCFHVVAEYRASGEKVEQHIAAMKRIEKEVFGREMQIPTAWPHDMGSRNSNLEPIKDLFARFGLPMMRESASLPKVQGVAARSLEGSIAEIDMRERCGAWKVSARCRFYLEERRMYHRKDNEIVALHDDTLSAARYAYMMRRFFKSRIDCGGGAVGTAAYSQWVRKQSAPGQRFAIGSANHPGGAYIWRLGGFPGGFPSTYVREASIR